MPFAKFSPGCPCCNSSTQYCLIDCNGKYLTPSVLFPSGSIQVFVEGSGGVLNSCYMPSGVTCCSTFIPTNSGVDFVLFSGGGYASFTQINNGILSDTDILSCCNDTIDGDTVWFPHASSVGNISVNFIAPSALYSQSFDSLGNFLGDTTYNLTQNFSFDFTYDERAPFQKWKSPCIYAGNVIIQTKSTDIFGHVTPSSTLSSNSSHIFYHFYLGCGSIIWNVSRYDGCGSIGEDICCKENCCAILLELYPPPGSSCSCGLFNDCMFIPVNAQSVNYNPIVAMGSLNIVPFTPSRDQTQGPYSCGLGFAGSIPYSGVISYSLMGAI